MSYRQKATNNYFGLMPVSAGPHASNFQVNYYLVSSSEGTQINIGDLVVQTSLDTVRVPSSGGTFIQTSSMGIVGVAGSILAANAGSTAAELLSLTSQMVLVYDDPGQMFTICESSSGVIGPQVGLYKNYRILATGVVGSTGPFQIGNAGRSAMALSGVESSVTGSFHVMSLDPVEQGHYTTQTSGTATTDVRKWLGRLVATINMQSTVSLTTVANTSS